MKLFFFFFLSSAFLTGCGTNYNYSAKDISVYKTDGSHKTYDLLSVRGDTAIVVLPMWESDLKPISFSHAEVIRQDSILRIVRNGYSIGTTTLVGAVGGAVIGAIWGGIRTAGFDNSTEYINSLQFTLILSALGAIGGLLPGVLVGGLFPSKRELFILSPLDREFLRGISLYPDKEPEIMQYVK